MPVCLGPPQPPHPGSFLLRVECASLHPDSPCVAFVGRVHFPEEASPPTLSCLTELCVWLLLASVQGGDVLGRGAGCAATSPKLRQEVRHRAEAAPVPWTGPWAPHPGLPLGKSSYGELWTLLFHSLLQKKAGWAARGTGRGPSPQPDKVTEGLST